jgi:RNA polymerase sigma factor (TIGR02999 family)
MPASQLTVLFNQFDLNDNEVLNKVYALLYSEIKSIAGFQIKQLNAGQTITPTVLAHECYLKISQTESIQLDNKRHFLNCLARVMRMYLIDVLRAKSSQKRSSQQIKHGLTQYVGEDDISIDLIEIDLALNQIEKIDTRLAEILQQKLIFNLTFSEIAAVFSMSERQVMRLWKQAKALLIAMLNIEEPSNE